MYFKNSIKLDKTHLKLKNVPGIIPSLKGEEARIGRKTDGRGWRRGEGRDKGS